MSDGKLLHEDVLEIIKLVEVGDAFTEFKLRYEGFEIEISKGARRAPASGGGEVVAMVSEPLLVSAAAPAAHGSAVTVAGAAVGGKDAPAIADRMVVIKAPMVGTFYSAPEPGAQPFVKVGSKVHAADTVCIIEVMKLMSALAADVSGVVVDVLVSDGQTVEYGQPLIVIEPNQ